MTLASPVGRETGLDFGALDCEATSSWDQLWIQTTNRVGFSI